jgi:hypothetical protein
MRLTSLKNVGIAGMLVCAALARAAPAIGADRPSAAVAHSITMADSDSRQMTEHFIRHLQKAREDRDRIERERA